MKMRLILALLLIGTTATLAEDAYDGLYVSDPAVCARAGEADMGAVLFDLKARAVAPRGGIWVGGELSCRLFDIHTNPSWLEVEEIYATARCTGPYMDFIDSVVVTSESQNIYQAIGDTDEEPPAMVEIMSLREDAGGDTIADYERYAGVYTICDGLDAKDFER